MNIIGYRKWYMGIAGAVIVASLILLATSGLNLGIDFQGGTLLERAVPGQVSVAAVEEVMADPTLEAYGFGRSFVQPLEGESPDETIFLIRTRDVSAGSEPLRAIDEALAARFGDVTIRRTEVVGPVIGEELQRQALWALLLSGIGMLIYISLRFEYRFGVVAVITILHDVIVVLGLLALLQIEINISFIAAILTVVGYSINDTIIIFDRIREHLRLRKKQQTLPELVNDSIRQTLARTINTTLTTLFVVVSLLLFGGASIKDFTLTLFVGILAGAYSSIFVAGPLWLEWRMLSERKAPAATKAA